MYKKIQINDLIKLHNISVIDVREQYEYIMGHIPNAINIPVNDIVEDYEKYLYKDQEYYIYCETNIRSSRVCNFLANLGYDVILLDGGYKAWVERNNNIEF